MTAFEDGVRDGMAKTAIDPVTAGGLLLAGKQLAANVVSRHALKIPGARRVAQEVAGVGARAGLAGREMPGRWSRELAAATTSPAAVGLFEGAHATGKALRAQGRVGGEIATQAMHSPLISKLGPDAVDAQRFVAGVPLESKGLRRAVDYTLKPVGEVASDISAGVKRKIRGALNRRAEARGRPITPEVVKQAAGSRAEAAQEILGLGLIAAPVAHGMVQRARGKKLTHRQEQIHAVSDLAGLGILAAPYAKALVKRAAARPDKKELRRRRRRAAGAAIGGVLGAGAGFAAPVAAMYANKGLGVPNWSATVPIGTAIGSTVGGLIGGRKKEASGGAASPDTTGGNATTSGELERDVSAPGVSGQIWSQLDMDTRVEPRPKTGRGRGVPEWVRTLSRQAAADEIRQ